MDGRISATVSRCFIPIMYRYSTIPGGAGFRNHPLKSIHIHSLLWLLYIYMYRFPKEKRYLLNHHRFSRDFPLQSIHFRVPPIDENLQLRFAWPRSALLTIYSTFMKGHCVPDGCSSGNSMAGKSHINRALNAKMMYIYIHIYLYISISIYTYIDI